MPHPGRPRAMLRPSRSIGGGETDQREGGEVRGCVGRRRRARGAFRAEKSGKAVRTDPTGIREWRVGVSKKAGEREGGLEGRGRENEGSATGQGGGWRGTAGRSKEGESLVEAGTSSNDDPRERVSEYEIQIGCGRTWNLTMLRENEGEGVVVSSRRVRLHISPFFPTSQQQQHISNSPLHGSQPVLSADLPRAQTIAVLGRGH